MGVQRLLTALLLLTLSACSSWWQGLKQGITGEDAGTTSASASVAPINRTPSSTPLMTDELAAKPAATKRKEDPFDATGPASDGSLWNGDTQDNFYFAKNLVHKMGDILIVKIEPEVNEALNNRIASAFGRTSVQQVVADEAGKAAGAAAAQKVDAAVGNDNVAQAVGAAVNGRTVAALDEKPKYVEVDEVTVRIAENLPRGAYRIEGTKRVFIKSSPYVLKYSGVIRDEDLGPSNMIASSKVIDSKMELVK